MKLKLNDEVNGGQTQNDWNLERQILPSRKLIKKVTKYRSYHDQNNTNKNQRYCAYLCLFFHLQFAFKTIAAKSEQNKKQTLNIDFLKNKKKTSLNLKVL